MGIAAPISASTANGSHALPPTLWRTKSRKSALRSARSTRATTIARRYPIISARPCSRSSSARYSVIVAFTAR